MFVNLGNLCEYRVFSPYFPPILNKKRVLRPNLPGDESVITYRFGRDCGKIKLYILFLSLILI